MVFQREKLWPPIFFPTWKLNTCKNICLFFCFSTRRAFFQQLICMIQKNKCELVVEKFHLKTKALHETTFNNITKVKSFGFFENCWQKSDRPEKTNEKKVCWTKIAKGNQAAKHFLFCSYYCCNLCSVRKKWKQFSKDIFK